MTAPVALLTRLFLLPAAGEVLVTIDAALPPAVAVVGRDRRAVAAGCAVGLTLARRRRASAALVCVRGCGVGAGWRAAPALGARRLASVVGAGGTPVAAGGRLVLVDLDAPDDNGGQRLAPNDAVARAEQAMGVAGDAPTILVLAGPREAQFDRLLDAQDAVGVCGGPGDPPSLADLALTRLPAGAVSFDTHVSPLAAVLAAGGIAVLPSLAGVVAPLIEAIE